MARIKPNAFWDILRKELGPDFVEDTKLHATVRRLSEAFTDGRGDLGVGYIASKDIQKAYLAYYLPLNFEKIRGLLESHNWEIPESGEIVICDFGCGPATATLAALDVIKARVKASDKLKIKAWLIDFQGGVHEVAKRLVNNYAAKLGLNVDVEARKEIPPGEVFDLSIAANVLNELPTIEAQKKGDLIFTLAEQTRGSVLVMEPSHRVASQRLIRFRERVLKDIPEMKILGPCLHAERCPLYRSKHWCHFSEPTDNGSLLDLNIRIFKDKRSWLKFSYLFFSRTGEADARFKEKGVVRLIGDVHQSGPHLLVVDTCKPLEKGHISFPKNIPIALQKKLLRGAVVKLKGQLNQVEWTRTLFKRAKE